MCHVDNVKGEKINNGRNRITKSETLDPKKKEKYWNIGIGHYQTNRNERKRET